jgi:hypothetical protein
MCALFGSSRDVSMIRKVNRELLGNVMSQQCVLYKVNLEKTVSNIYGESTNKRYYTEPTILFTRITRTDPSFESTDIGPNYVRVVTFSFLRDDLVEANAFPELGDIVMYYEDYFEIEQSFNNQLFTGKDPDYNYQQNPLNPGLENFGYNVSLNCVAHYVPADKVNLTRERE